MKLTQLALDNFKPGPKPREFPDGYVPGLYILVAPSGHLTWTFRFRVHGRPRKLTIGRFGLKDACTRAQEAAAAVGRGEGPMRG